MVGLLIWITEKNVNAASLQEIGVLGIEIDDTLNVLQVG